MKHFRIQKVKAYLLCAFFSLMCIGCGAQSNNPTSMFAPIDSMMRAEIGDSISTLILSSKQVLAERVFIQNGTMSVSAKKKLKNEEASIIKFLFATNEEFKDSAIVFGHFSPSIRFTFRVSKKIFCVAYVDFGLKQVVLRDSKGKDMKMFGVKDDRFIKLANIIFPHDKFLTFMLNQK